jgi:hypothetical protein
LIIKYLDRISNKKSPENGALSSFQAVLKHEHMNTCPREHRLYNDDNQVQKQQNQQENHGFRGFGV